MKPKRLIIEMPETRWIPKLKAKNISLRHFLAILFRENEQRYLRDEQPFSDEVIRELCRRKYPKMATVKSLFDGKKSINMYRAEFNAGSMERYIGVNYRHFQYISFRYDEFGKRVNGRSGYRELTEEEQTEWVRKYEEVRKERGLLFGPPRKQTQTKDS